MPTSKIIKNLVDAAKEKGASSIKLISAKDVYVDDSVRQKCQYGCRKFAKRFTCPPYAPTPDETKKTMKNYYKALLVEFSWPKETEERRKFHEVMFELEREAFLSGLYRAFAYTAGPCRHCEICPAENIKDRNEFSKKECRHPLKARPSMEACGIDVYKTIRKAGFKVDVAEEGGSFKSFGLLLLE